MNVTNRSAQSCLISQQITCKLNQSEEIVAEKMVILSNKRLGQLSHNAVAKSMFSDAAILFSSVNLKIAYVAV